MTWLLECDLNHKLLECDLKPLATSPGLCGKSLRLQWVEITHLPCCEDDCCELRAVTPLCKEGEGEGLDEDRGDERAKASQFPPEGRTGSEALLWVGHRILGELCGTCTAGKEIKTLTGE